MSKPARESITVNYSVAGLLGVAFIILKLCGVINWSWLWVLSPFWIPLAIVLAAAVAVGIIAILPERKKK